jgi:hypothetical protein
MLPLEPQLQRLANTAEVSAYKLGAKGLRSLENLLER